MCIINIDNVNDFSILSRDGLLLAGYHWPSKNPKSLWSVLILIHGLAEHSG
jgi:alpha-beta hydrolase superfamily lysophospholipase